MYQRLQKEAEKLARQYDLTEDEAFSEARFVIDNRTVIGVTVNPNGKRYYYVQQLGEGTFGTVYTASDDRALRTVEYVVKDLATEPRGNTTLNDSTGSNVPMQDVSDYTDMIVEREYLMSKVIQRRLGVQFCRENVVCALERFYKRDETGGIIVFPFSTPRTLGAYLALYTHGAMKTLDAQLFQKYKRDDIDRRALRQLTTVTVASEAAAAAEFLRSMQFIQSFCLTLALQISKSVALLHSQSLFHVDLKPDNIVVEGGTTNENANLLRALLIDFGIGCALPNDADRAFSKMERQFLVCDDIYDTTADFLDPLARRMRISDVREEEMRYERAFELYAKFDTYSVGKLLQCIFDPTIFNNRGRYIKYPVVRRTRYMPESVYQLIVAMTGEEKYTADDRYEFPLTNEQYTKRGEAFMKRPTMPEVTTQLANISFEWNNY